MAAFATLENIARKIYRGLRAQFYARRTREEARRHIAYFNNNPLFYTASPNLLIALVRSFNYLKANHPALLQNGSYLEFGLFKGFSLWFAELLSREYVGKDFRLYGFDSFCGLPPSVVDKAEAYWAPGAYACSIEDVSNSIEKSGGDFARITLVKGFYSEDVFRKALSNIALKPPAIVVIDSDIYESCKIVLDYFGPMLREGTIILFDDFNAFERSDKHGERRALKEFSAAHPSFRTREMFDFGWHGTAVIVEHAS